MLKKRTKRDLKSADKTFAFTQTDDNEFTGFDDDSDDFFGDTSAFDSVFDGDDGYGPFSEASPFGDEFNDAFNDNRKKDKCDIDSNNLPKMGIFIGRNGTALEPRKINTGKHIYHYSFHCVSCTEQ